MGWVIVVVVAVIKIIVDDDHRPVVPAQRTPTDIIITPVPVDPGGPPMPSGNPVPTEAQSPMPPSVMVYTPAPGFVGYPGPATNGIPNPAAIVVRPPVGINDIGHPDIPVWSFINPIATRFELGLVDIELVRQVTPRSVLPEQRIPILVPVVKIVPS